MNDRGWEELVDLIDQKYQIDQHHNSREPLPDNRSLHRDVELIEFEKDNQKYKIERVTAPRIVDKKTYYHKVGSSEHSEYVYDPIETTNKVTFYAQTPDGHWNEIGPEQLLR